MRLVVTIGPGHDSDVVAGRLWAAGTTGIEECGSELVAGFAHRDDLARARRALVDLTTTVLDDTDADGHHTDVVERWRDFAGPQWLGTDAVVVPAWRPRAVDGADLVVVLDPGDAFGYGNHPTTAALGARLRSVGMAGRSVLDLGSGSGILSVLAAMSGADRVTVVDTSAGARHATAANALRNSVDATVTVRGASVEDAAPAAPFDIIVANLPVDAHERTARRSAGLLGSTGEVWVTGVITAQVDRVVAAYRAAGMAEPSEIVGLDEDWVLLVIGRSCHATPPAPSMP